MNFNTLKRSFENTRYVLAFLIIILTACNIDKPSKPILIPKQIKSIRLIPLGNIDKDILTFTFKQLTKFLPNLEILPTTNMPSSAYYKPRGRYRADSLIHWLSSKAKPNEIYVGITGYDISTTKGVHEDWGVMGLSYVPGKACVVSYLRLKDKANFYKVVIHEIGHSMGLPHCPNKTCFMRDADGKDTTDEETSFCSNCKKVFNT